MAVAASQIWYQLAKSRDLLPLTLSRHLGAFRQTINVLCHKGLGGVFTTIVWGDIGCRKRFLYTWFVNVMLCEESILS